LGLDGSIVALVAVEVPLPAAVLGLVDVGLDYVGFDTAYLISPGFKIALAPVLPEVAVVFFTSSFLTPITLREANVAGLITDLTPTPLYETSLVADTITCLDPADL
jgi:hypothetical protein